MQHHSSALHVDLEILFNCLPSSPVSWIPVTGGFAAWTERMDGRQARLDWRS